MPAHMSVRGPDFEESDVGGIVHFEHHRRHQRGELVGGAMRTGLMTKCPPM